MSREFRHVSGGYLHAVLDDAADEPGNHEISRALADIYRALQPLEYDCASVEASDSGPSRATLGLQREWAAIEAAVGRLCGIYRRDHELIDDLLRERVKP